jgi:hypothetical protein
MGRLFPVKNIAKEDFSGILMIEGDLLIKRNEILVSDVTSQVRWLNGIQL